MSCFSVVHQVLNNDIIILFIYLFISSYQQLAKKSEKSKKKDNVQQILITKQIPQSTIAPISNVDSKYCSKIIQPPNLAMQKQILIPGSAMVLASQIQPSQFDSKFSSKFNSSDVSVMSALSSQGGGSSVLGSQLNPSDFQSSALGGQSSFGGGSSATSSFASSASSASSTPFSAMSDFGGSSFAGGSNAYSSMAGGSQAYSSFAGQGKNSSVVSSGVSKPGDGTSYFSGVTSLAVDPTSKLGGESKATSGDPKINVTVTISKAPQQQQHPPAEAPNGNLQKLYTPSQIFTKFLDENKQQSQTHPQTSTTVKQLPTTTATTTSTSNTFTKQPVAKFSKV